MIEEEFFGRAKELAMLDTAWRAPGGAMIPVYGRRRVGKSEMIVHFQKSRRGSIYYMGKRAPADLQIREFLETAGAALNEPLLAAYPATDWATAFKVVADRWQGPEKLIIALDEFQWMCESSPELPSVLQEVWDRRWRKGGIMLILCGSYLGFMEREVLGKKSPLFGRRTAQILLKPFGYQEAALFHPHYSVTDKARTYFICGGMPYYLKAFSPARSVEQNIAGTLFDEMGVLYREPDFLLREELRELANYHSILMALAAGKTMAREIAAASGIGDRSLQFYLTTLLELGYITRRYPLTGSPATARSVRWSLEDPLLRFWFRFVFPNMSRVARSTPQQAVQEIVKPQLDAYFGHCFERLCREALPVLYAREGISANGETGEYWDKETQIDVVGLRDDGWTDLGECKWATGGSAAALRKELEPRSARFPNARAATLGLRYFTRLPVRNAEPKPNERWHTLAELYGG
ncbi:MAG TPA: ATP-binding protein [Verrucomicrobiales bacterium]|nr:ATP-binding protein [Verrucomicrobiales bacterium]